ncbi:antitoxin HicB [Cutibacterium acnes]|mgnify:FL=1|jgi:hypothetical protein|nr:hypothetical protein [Cutibacterium acnes]EFS37309.1 hypothetical protein HMPREF9574_02364 [Cutibacterium acnes HL074PA1]EGE93476.1 hypothetical protein HMPREF9570_01702 [Cutibacterium acnes HL043PA1]EGE97830.1 hypothetical protein HMPREF9571_00031 [Cutibacterium acnes HL043PA2]EGE99293.1 hypothetical protein HMPREF9581_01300 [Cutibacterium acnes HL087PA3]MCM4185988.1 hypothetical protein [Cutibacterium acnes P09]RFT44628.1 antitoxin HicB [Staphylococcus epidermidis]GAE74332.1 hypothetica
MISMRSPRKPYQKIRRGPKPRCEEPVRSLTCYVPQSLIDPIDEMAWQLEISKSDLVGWSALCTLNVVRRDRGEDPIPIPEYLDKAVLTALYPDGLPFDEDTEEPGENAGQEELAMTG